MVSTEYYVAITKADQGLIDSKEERAYNCNIISLYIYQNVNIILLLYLVTLAALVPMVTVETATIFSTGLYFTKYALICPFHS